MAATSIEWTDHSVSPIRARDKATGKVFHFCEKISPGCTHCYAATMARRFGLPDYVKANRDKVEFFLDETKLREVLRRRKPTRYFWEDCSDLMGDWVPDEWIDRCFAAMALTSQHTHQVLSKRPERLREYMQTRAYRAYNDVRLETEVFPPPNIWLGVSVEDQRRKDRIDVLRQCPAAVRFLSLEPLLEDLGQLDLAGIHWVIVGSESGPGARPMQEEWVRSLRDQCVAAAVPFFYKQQMADGRKVSLPELDGRRWCQFPSEPGARSPERGAPEAPRSGLRAPGWRGGKDGS